MSADRVLALDGIGVAFGGNVVFSELSLAFDDGFNGLVGPNGAGKTTLFNVISGFVRPQHGSVRLTGREITGMKPSRVAALGIGRTFQTPRLIQEMAVIDNVALGRHSQTPANHISEFLSLPGARRAERGARDMAVQMLERFGLSDRAYDEAGSVPLGSQKIVEVARAMLSAPRVLLVDEPAAGLGADDVAALLRGLRSIAAERELCVIVIEHDLGLVSELCERVAVLDFGSIIADGNPHDVVRDPGVIEAYLGAGIVTRD